MTESLPILLKNSWKLFLSLGIGIALGISITNHFFSIWGKSLWTQIEIFAGSGIIFGIVVYWWLFTSRYTKNINWRNKRFWLYIIIAGPYTQFCKIANIITPSAFAF